MGPQRKYVEGPGCQLRKFVVVIWEEEICTLMGVQGLK